MPTKKSTPGRSLPAITSLKHTDMRANVPASLAPFFQEYDLTRLDLERSAGTIIERVLQYGNRVEIRWLFSIYPRQRVVDWVRQWGQYALPEPHRTFWRLMLDLPEVR